MVFLFKSVQVRTTNLNLLTHYFTPLLHNTGVNIFHPCFFRIVYLSFRFLFGIVFLFRVEAEGYSRLLPDVFVSCRLTAFFLLLPGSSCSEIAHFRRTDNRK